MLELRITVLRDEPSSELLDKHAANGYNLVHDTETGLFFLTNGTTDNFELNGFGSDYSRILDIPFDCDWSYLTTFKSNHRDLLKNTVIHDEILLDALALSKAFSTCVLCVYSTDEDCDFAVTADNGKLLRLRFQAGDKQGKRVEDGIFEYTRFEVLQTVDKPLALSSFWQFREGEIGGQVTLETISSRPDGIEPSLMFRNAFLEFKEAFGQVPPDFTDVPEENRFRRIAFQAPPEIPAIAKAINFVKSLLAIIIGSRTAMIWALGIILVLAVAIFGNDNTQTNKQKVFADYCAVAGGNISGEFDDKCSIENLTYRNWNLPGVKGERRIMILKVGPEQIPCNDHATRKCLMVDGEKFYDQIEGFTFRRGKQQVVPVERIQICDPEMFNGCPQDAGAFRFKQLFDLEK